MEIFVGKTAGFCFGVKRAVDKTFEQAKSSSDKAVYCLGELVHNKNVIEKLEKNGIKIVNNVDDIQNMNSTVIIRAHGVAPNIYDELNNKGIELVDCTCPFVKRIHDLVESYTSKGFFTFIIGDKNHPEVIGTHGYCNKNSAIISEKEDINSAVENLLKSNCQNLLIVSQTTFNRTLFEEITTEIKEEIGSKINIKIENTICNATAERQKETDEMAKIMDCMIIVGGKNSSNTKKLYEIASKNTDAILVETAEEIDVNNLKKYNKIGIMAGASTPQDIIIEVEKLVKE